MPEFTIEGFAASCKAAMSAAEDRHDAASTYLREVIAKRTPDEIIAVLEAAIPADADIGEMIVHQSDELTMLYGRIPPHFQTGIHNHTVFACIGQLVGEERNLFYAQDEIAGLRITGVVSTYPGQVLDLGTDVVHQVENPSGETTSALHIYGGDFQALMEQRSLWSSVEYEEMPFTYPDLMRESAIAMKMDDNQAGLDAMVAAIPAMKDVVAAVEVMAAETDDDDDDDPDEA